MSKLVSVVILSYNHSSFIKNSIKSISEQYYNNVEIIIIDDGSTDDTVEVLEALKDKYDFILLTKENGGVVSSINLAIKEVRGEYTIFHASDDISLLCRISNQVDVLSNFPDAGFVSSNINLVNTDGIHKKELLKRNGTKVIRLDDALLGSDISSVGCMYRTKFLKKIVLDECYIAEDPQIHFRILEVCPYSVIDYGEPVLNYYLNVGGQMGTNESQLHLQHLDLLNEYKNHIHYAQAARLVQINYLSYLSSCCKKKALAYFFKNFILIKTPGFHRVLFKLIIPTKFHIFFRNSRC